MKRKGQETGAEAYLPRRSSLSQLRAAAARCEGCDLYKHATQTVFGEGPARATVMLVGEQPGDAEDKAGHPFVGPAGRLLHEAIHEAKLTRGLYITNAVKHFKYVWRGKRRIHAKPKRLEIQACRPWLASEIEAVRPSVIVALGATAAQSLLGPDFRLTKHRGRFVPSPWAAKVLATIHPSAILRAPDDASRQLAMKGFVNDLKIVAAAARGARPSRVPKSAVD